MEYIIRINVQSHKQLIKNNEVFFIKKVELIFALFGRYPWVSDKPSVFVSSPVASIERDCSC